MSIVNITLPLASFERLVRAVERIANTCERAFPSPLTEEDLRLAAPTSGVTVVTNEMLLEEEVREGLRLRGFMPDDIERMIAEDNGRLEERLDA
jgi:hypothetical protein